MQPVQSGTRMPSWLPDSVPGLRTHVVALVAAALLPAFAVGAIAVGAAIGSYRQAFDDRLEGTASALASAIQSEVASHVVALSTLATAQSLDRGGDLAAFAARARQTADLLGTRVVIVAPDLSLLHTQFEPGGTGRPPREEFAAAARQVFDTGRPAVGNLAWGEMSGRWVVPVYVPVTREGQVTFVLGMTLDAERVSRMLGAQAFRENGYASLVDGNGLIVARSSEPERYVGEAVRNWVVEGVRGGASGIMHGNNRSGIEVVTAFQHVSGAPGWFVIVAEPLSTYHASLRGPLSTLAIGGLGAVGIALACAVWIGWQVLRPVDWLTQKAERVAVSGGAADIASEGPRVRVREFERLRAAVLQAHVALRERARAVAAGEARLRAVVDTAADAIVVTNEAGTIISFNRAAELIFGYSAPEAIGTNVRTFIGAQHEASAAFRAVDREQQLTGREREIEGFRKNGSRVPLDLSIAEWRDAEGQPFSTMIMRDISLRKAAEVRQEMLSREVDHRAKNILAVVQSVLRLTPQDRPGALAAAEKRVAGLARAHTLLAEAGWIGADLRVVAERELAPFMETSSGQDRPPVRLNGPPVGLAPSAVQPMAMVLHELATNAAKHGALSEPAGRVEMQWRAGRRKGEDGLLHLRWAEAGGPPVAGPPERRGFGTRVIDATVRGQLGGTVERRWSPSGVVVEITVPLARVLAGDEAAEPQSGSAARANAA